MFSGMEPHLGLQGGYDTGRGNLEGIGVGDAEITLIGLGKFDVPEVQHESEILRLGPGLSLHPYIQIISIYGHRTMGYTHIWSSRERES